MAALVGPAVEILGVGLLWELGVIKTTRDSLSSACKQEQAREVEIRFEDSASGFPTSFTCTSGNSANTCRLCWRSSSSSSGGLFVYNLSSSGEYKVPTFAVQNFRESGSEKIIKLFLRYVRPERANFANFHGQKFRS